MLTKDSLRACARAAAALLVDKIGRRPLFLMSNTGMVLVFIIWTITTALWTTEENRPAANGLSLFTLF